MSTDTDSSEETPHLLSPRRHVLFAGRRGLVASTVSTAVVLVVIITLLYFAPGGVRVRASYFNFHDMWVAWNGDPSKGILAIRDGIWTNVWMFLVSEVLVLLFGLALAWTRITKSPVLLPFRVLATAYSDIFLGGLWTTGPLFESRHRATTRLWRDHAHLVVLGVRLGSLSRGHPLSAERSTARRSIAGSHAVLDHAPGHLAPGRSHGDRALVERLHLATEGHGVGLGDWRRRNCPFGADLSVDRL